VVGSVSISKIDAID